MNIRCRICGEPWDMDCIHEAIAEQYPDHKNACTIDGKWSQAKYEQEFYNPMRAKFTKEGCRAIDPGATYCQPDERTAGRSSTLDAIRDLAGDDGDFAASMEEDAEAMGLL